MTMVFTSRSPKRFGWVQAIEYEIQDSEEEKEPSFYMNISLKLASH